MVRALTAVTMGENSSVAHEGARRLREYGWAVKTAVHHTERRIQAWMYRTQAPLILDPDVMAQIEGIPSSGSLQVGIAELGDEVNRTQIVYEGRIGPDFTKVVDSLVAFTEPIPQELPQPIRWE